MNAVRFDNPPISFNPTHLFITKQNEVSYEIHIDGFSKGHIITRNNEWAFQIADYTLTDKDKDFLIEGAKSLSITEPVKNPKEASNIFHSIMKASVSKTATEKKPKKSKPKPKK